MKTKPLFMVMMCLVFFCCSPKLSTETAVNILKTSFHLTDQDKLEVIGVSKETGNVMLVKFSINDVQLNSKMQKYDKGWQLEEIQNEMGTWLPAAKMIEQFDPAKKIDLALTEVNAVALGLADYVTDNAKFAFNGGPVTAGTEMNDALCPFYLKSLPANDPWGGQYVIYLGKEIDTAGYGFSNSSDVDFLVVSWGKDRKPENWTYDPDDPQEGITSDLDPDKDIINFNGTCIRGPKSK